MPAWLPHGQGYANTEQDLDDVGKDSYHHVSCIGRWSRLPD